MKGEIQIDKNDENEEKDYEVDFDEDIDDSDEGNHSDKENYKKIRLEAKNKTIKKKKNLGAVLGGLLKKKTKSDTILVGNKSAFKKIDDEREKENELRIKRKLRTEQKKRGFKTIEEWDKLQEKKSNKVATKGVVKLFNSIFDFRKKIRDEKVKEGNNIYLSLLLDSQKDRKSTNFLMMHNLDPTLTQNKLKKSNNKTFEEDN